VKQLSVELPTVKFMFWTLPPSFYALIKGRRQAGADC
jgi:hypothetical protein